MKCSGHEVVTRERIEVEFDSVISHVDPLFEDGDEGIFVAPGFVDLQVNGFAGADYNSPNTPHDELFRSIRTIFSTGVTRFFPTVITGSPENMVGALRNLAAAREASDDSKAMEAFHVEGPHISAEEGPRGAHPRQWSSGISIA
jgi:N-acetylglucosamine-6-phosphate deacetylase